jgi:hypothetical protein
MKMTVSAELLLVGGNKQGVSVLLKDVFTSGQMGFRGQCFWRASLFKNTGTNKQIT